MQKENSSDAQVNNGINPTVIEWVGKLTKYMVGLTLQFILLSFAL